MKSTLEKAKYSDELFARARTNFILRKRIKSEDVLIRYKNRRPAFLPRFVLFGCAVLAFVTATHAPAAVADFSGTWKLDAKQSDFAQLPGPSAVTDRVTQTAGEVVINRDREGEAVVIHVPLDGSERENSIRGMPTKTRGHVDGSVLVVNFDNSRAHSEERWTKSADGRILTVKRHITSPRGDADQTLVMARQ